MMFEFFPSNYAWSLGVAMSLAMGGEISEISDACRPLMALAPGASQAIATETWFSGWVTIAEKVKRLGAEAQQKGWDFSASDLYLRAANYYLMAERPMPWADPRKVLTYNKAREILKGATGRSGQRVERVEIPYEGKTLAGLLSFPNGAGPHPVVVFLNGFDTIKEMHYLMCDKAASRRGLAVLYIDQEGTGEAMRLQGLTKRVDSESSVKKFIDYLETRSDIDPGRIGVVGISNGGYDAPRAAAFEDRIKCVACYGAFFNGDDYLDKLTGGDVNISKGISDIDGHMMQVMGKPTPRDAYLAFMERDLAPVIGKVTVPLLVVHGENDRQVPLIHAERTVQGAINSPRVDFKLFTITDGGCEHCGADIVSLQVQYVFDWLAQELSGRTHS